jgi:hypothetical protein
MADGQPFIGSEALASGLVNRHELRRYHQAVMPNVYLDKRAEPSLRDRTCAAWLWSRRQGVVSGLAASNLHGSRWVDDDIPVELIYRNARAPQGVITRDDLLARATDFKAPDVAELASRHGHARGLRQLEVALDLVDAGAESPRESALRLLLIGAGYPRPQTQVPVVSDDGYRQYYLDMGWEELMLAVEYDGDHHRLDRTRFAYEIQRAEDIAEVGWLVIRVAARHRRADVLRRVAHAWDGRTR